MEQSIAVSYTLPVLFKLTVEQSIYLAYTLAPLSIISIETINCVILYNSLLCIWTVDTIKLCIKYIHRTLYIINWTIRLFVASIETTKFTNEKKQDLIHFPITSTIAKSHDSLKLNYQGKPHVPRTMCTHTT